MPAEFKCFQQTLLLLLELQEEEEAIMPGFEFCGNVMVELLAPTGIWVIAVVHSLVLLRRRFLQKLIGAEI